MNQKQKILILVGILIVLFMGLFPHWLKITNIPIQGSSWHSEESGGYHLLFKPPESSLVNYYKLDVSRLFIQWIGVCILIIGLILFFKNGKQAVVEVESETLETLPNPDTLLDTSKHNVSETAFSHVEIKLAERLRRDIDAIKKRAAITGRSARQFLLDAGYDHRMVDMVLIESEEE